MYPIPIWKILMMIITALLQMSMNVNSESKEVRDALLQFMDRISLGKIPRDPNFGWNSSSDPCRGNWTGIECDKQSQQFVKKIILDRSNLSGILDFESLCKAQKLAVLSLNENLVIGTLTEDISSCKSLTHLYLRRNNFTGPLPVSIIGLVKLNRIAISNNSFSGELPRDLPNIPGLVSFEAEYNRFTGGIPPGFNFTRLNEFNVSYNNLSGPVPEANGDLSPTSFLGNPGLCGALISKPCPPLPPRPLSPPPSQPDGKKKKKSTSFFVYLGYIGLAVVVLLLVLYTLITRLRKKKTKVERRKGTTKGVSSSGESKGKKSEYSMTSGESGRISSSFEILSSPPVVGGTLRFEELLQAPAEMLGKGKHGSSYKVVINGGVNLVVKRIRGWDIVKDEFKKRMLRISQVKHPNVLSLVGYYCSRQEKLLVYEYMQHGSLLNLLNEAKNNGQVFDWGRRLAIAATISKALAFMHQGLLRDKIAHGNLKSSNILIMNKEMEVCISEYGLMPVENPPPGEETDVIRAEDSNASLFRSDVYSFGVILLELLTGKPVRSRGAELTGWVNSVVREEWTGEVFDKTLVSQGASEEQMMSVLHLALKCANATPEDRPNSTQISEMIDSIIKDDGDDKD